MEMKCQACGYEHKTDYLHHFDNPVIKGGEEFILIGGRFFIDDKSNYPPIREIYLFICPKCGTVKADI